MDALTDISEKDAAGYKKRRFGLATSEAMLAFMGLDWLGAMTISCGAMTFKTRQRDSTLIWTGSKARKQAQGLRPASAQPCSSPCLAQPGSKAGEPCPKAGTMRACMLLQPGARVASSPHSQQRSAVRHRTKASSSLGLAGSTDSLNARAPSQYGNVNQHRATTASLPERARAGGSCGGRRCRGTRAHLHGLCGAHGLELPLGDAGPDGKQEHGHGSGTGQENRQRPHRRLRHGRAGVVSTASAAGCTLVDRPAVASIASCKDAISPCCFWLAVLSNVTCKPCLDWHQRIGGLLVPKTVSSIALMRAPAVGRGSPTRAVFASGSPLSGSNDCLCTWCDVAALRPSAPPSDRHKRTVMCLDLASRE